MAEPHEKEKVMFLFFSMDGMGLMGPPEAPKLDGYKKGIPTRFLPLWTLRM